MRAEQEATMAIRAQLREQLLAVNAHVESPVLIVEQKNAVQQSRGKSMAMPKCVSQARFMREHFAQIFFGCGMRRRGEEQKIHAHRI